MNQNLFTQEPSYQQSFKQKTKPKMNINMILYTMQIVQNVMKVVQEKQKEDCKIE